MTITKEKQGFFFLKFIFRRFLHQRFSLLLHQMLSGALSSSSYHCYKKHHHHNHHYHFCNHHHNHHCNHHNDCHNIADKFWDEVREMQPFCGGRSGQCSREYISPGEKYSLLVISIFSIFSIPLRPQSLSTYDSISPTVNSGHRLKKHVPVM